MFLDESLKKFLPFDQLIILGAGLDSRAWRLKELENVTVYEVDHPITQKWKIDRANQLTVSPSANVRFVPVDFAKDNLEDCLIQAGFDRQKRTFWICEGVTMYLEEADVRKTLKQVADLSLGSAGMALTYLYTPNGKTPFAWWVSILGEPFQSAFTPERLNELATTNGGWRTVFDTGHDDWRSMWTPNYQLPFSILGYGLAERIWVGSINC
jgi:methyltransferase (TIGR00027 family)